MISKKFDTRPPCLLCPIFPGLNLCFCMILYDAAVPSSTYISASLPVFYSIALEREVFTATI